jgi:transcriptional regulator with XRE-family HTH domain
MALDYNVIGQRIKHARLAKNLTQEDLAEQIDISVAFLSRVERGNSHINLKRLNQLCRLLDVSEGYILNGASSNSTNYLDKEFSELLKSCSPETQRLIYNVAQVIAESENTDSEEA